jgi:NAD(P)H-dependent FMN reductase
MKLTVYNGSPRGQKSNTRILLDHFLRGFGETPGNTVQVLYLNHIHNQAGFLEAYAGADVVLLAFPLYTDGMPGMVKLFIETLRPLRGKANAPAIAFLVQSGFMEPAHSRYVERYLEKLAARLGCRYLGTMVKGGVEGIQAQPENMTHKLFEAFYSLGKTFGETGQLDDAQVRALAGWEHLPGWLKILFALLAPTGLTNFYWNGQLKQNGAYANRFARPYAEK